MPTLTIEAIRENPWIVLADPLPTNPPPLLLKVAYLAAEYCRRIEYLIMTAARAGDYEPAGWFAADTSPDVHEDSESWWLAAEMRMEAIAELYERNFGVKLQL